jgi:hypothetical protein
MPPPGVSAAIHLHAFDQAEELHLIQIKSCAHHDQAVVCCETQQLAVVSHYNISEIWPPKTVDCTIEDSCVPKNNV